MPGLAGQTQPLVVEAISCAILVDTCFLHAVWPCMPCALILITSIPQQAKLGLGQTLETAACVPQLTCAKPPSPRSMTTSYCSLMGWSVQICHPCIPSSPVQVQHANILLQAYPRNQILQQQPPGEGSMICMLPEAVKAAHLKAWVCLYGGSCF